MRQLTIDETDLVSAGTMNATLLLMTTLGGMLVGGATGGYYAMHYAFTSASQVVLTPLFAACCAGVGGTTGLGFGLIL